MRLVRQVKFDTSRFVNRSSADSESTPPSADLKLAASVLSAPSAAVHPLEQQYNSLRAKLTPLDAATSTYAVLTKMLAVETEGEQGLWRLELADAFAVECEGQARLEARGARKLLWCGAQSKSCWLLR